MHCRGGHPDQNKRPGEKHATTKSTGLIKCPFEATAYLRKKGVNQWNILVKNSKHNHEPSESMAAHTTNRKLTPALYEEMKALGEAGLKPSEILLALKKTHPNKRILATISMIYTARKKAWEEVL
jgi:malonate-semialdehyde dehydrogenase (acetylating)/methylmalonate-semialdehyde dehydrogenase